MLRIALATILLLAVTACTSDAKAPDPDHGEHYQEWHEPSGWHPDYHDSTRQ